MAAAESRSFTKAAEQFYISQTAITQQIRLLEEALGCPLFDRSTRPVSLTPAGTIFLREAKGILERMSRAQERVHDASTGLSGTLRVGYVRGYERSDLSTHVRQFHQQNSNVLITFYRCSTDALAAGLLHHEYDIIFTWDSTNLKTQEGVACRTVEKARLVVALYAGHPLAQRQQLRRQELRGEAILYMSPDAADDSYGDAFFMQLYNEAGYKPNILFRSADGLRRGRHFHPPRLLRGKALQRRQSGVCPPHRRGRGGGNHRRVADHQPQPRAGPVSGYDSSPMGMSRPVSAPTR